MRWFFYNILFALVYMAMMPYFLMRMWRRGGYGNGFMQRFGRYAPDVANRLKELRLWIHAVSVGEILVALKFIELYRAAVPGIAFILSTTTSTGHALARKRLNDRDVLIYFPVDFPWITRRVLQKMNLQGLILTEGELWPNLIRALAKRKIPLAIINGRLSDKSYRGYRKMAAFARPLLKEFSVVCMQSHGEADRMNELGVAAGRLQVMGNAKYDVVDTKSADPQKIRSLFDAAGFPSDAVVVLGGSTWAGEEKILVEIYRALQPSIPHVRLVLVPRHVERAEAILAELKDLGVSSMRRSQCPAQGTIPVAGQGLPPVLLVDTTGELQGLYAGADVIFVGKSLTQHGGQNIIEPAQYGKAVIVGPNMENFMGVMDDFLSANALIQVRDRAQLEVVIRRLLDNPGERQVLGERAGRVVAAHRGVLPETVRIVRAAFQSQKM